ncbi:unnamed protein product [Brassica oleracea]
MAGPGLSQPCFACPPFGVAFGMVCGASDCSPVVNSNDRLSCYRFPEEAFLVDTRKRLRGQSVSLSLSLSRESSLPVGTSNPKTARREEMKLRRRR